MIVRLILTALLLSGCASAPSQKSHVQLRAERVARVYAVESLGLSESQVARMKADFKGYRPAPGREITIQFYDPTVLLPNPDGVFPPMMGGFPSYFRITVDIQTWEVVDHYASPE